MDPLLGVIQYSPANTEQFQHRPSPSVQWPPLFFYARGKVRNRLTLFISRPWERIHPPSGSRSLPQVTCKVVRGTYQLLAPNPTSPFLSTRGQVLIYSEPPAGSGNRPPPSPWPTYCLPRERDLRRFAPGGPLRFESSSPRATVWFLNLFDDLFVHISAVHSQGDGQRQMTSHRSSPNE